MTELDFFESDSLTKDVVGDEPFSTIVPFGSKVNDILNFLDGEIPSISQEFFTPTTRDDVAEKSVRRFKDNFQFQFSRLLSHTVFEYGYDSPSEIFVRDSLREFGPFVREWISELFIVNFDDPDLLCSILRTIAHFEYHEMHPQGDTMAIAALKHKDSSVKECGIRCYENWEQASSIKILRSLDQFIDPDEWLNDYLYDVICDLESL